MATTFPTASTAGRKRSRKSLTDASTEMKRQHEAAGEMTTDHAHHHHHGSSSADEEKWAVQLLLLLKATDSARMLSDDDSDNDSDDQSESEAGDDDDNDDDGSESEEAEVEVEAEEEEYDNEVDSKTHVTPTPLLSVRRSARTKRSSGAMSAGDYVWGEAAAVEDDTAPMAVEGEAQVEADDESDVDDRASAVVHQQQHRDLSEDNQERPGNRGGHHQASAVMEEDDHGSSNEDEQPEEEEFSEGDEYVDPSSSSSSRRTRNYNNASGAVHTLTKAGASDNQLTIPPVSASAAGAPTPQFTTSRSASPSSPAPGGGKKTRKPKYSAALEARWEEKFEWLMSYRRAKGNCRVAEGNKEYPGLGKWLSNQKTLCKKGKLKAERRQKLIDVGAIADPALKAAARLGASQSPPSSPASLASPLPSSSIAHLGGDDEDAQGPLTKRRRKGHSLVVNIDRIPSMSSDQEVDSAVSSPSAASGLFSSSSPFRTYQGKPILPSLSFPHPMAPGGLHTHLPQQSQAQQQGLGGSTSFLSFALGAMPPVLFSPFSILGAPPGPTTNHLAPSHL